MKKTDKRIIGTDKAQETYLRQIGEKKVKIATSVIEMFYGSHLDIHDYQELAKDFTAYAELQLRKMMPHFPKEVSFDKLAEMVDLDINQLLKYQREFLKLNIDLNKDLSDYILPNLDITLDNEVEEARYELYERTKALVKDMKLQGHPVDIRALNKCIQVFNLLNPLGMEVNLHWVKSQRWN